LIKQSLEANASTNPVNSSNIKLPLNQNQFNIDSISKIAAGGFTTAAAKIQSNTTITPGIIRIHYKVQGLKRRKRGLSNT